MSREAGGEGSLLGRLEARGIYCRRGFSVGSQACPEQKQKPGKLEVDRIASALMDVCLDLGIN